jgi:hypothetical protein
MERINNMNMRYLIIIILLLSFAPGLFSQGESKYEEGTISYVSGSHVYAKFNSTKNINIGDTLLININGSLEPALLVNNKSSISCVCTKLIEFDPNTGTVVLHGNQTKEFNVADALTEIVDTSGQSEDAPKQSIDEKEGSSKTITKIADGPGKPESSYYGRLTASTYTSLKNLDFNESDDPRMRYTLSFRNNNIAGSNFHFDSYISFKHQLDHWDEVTSDFNRAFKTYSLALSYEGPKAEISVGRRINRNISNIGAVDGLHFDYKLGAFTFGTVLGTRPDIFDYGFNLDLPQAGIYFRHELHNENLFAQSTLGFFEQRFGQYTDRRFLYLQHSNNFIKNLYIFGSCEIDLYKKLDEAIEGDFKITSLYASARYRFNRKYSLFLSYDNRRNIIYYETYKSAIDRLIEQETRQGFRFRFVGRPFKYVSIGLGGTYRYQKNSLSPTKNANFYINYSRVPLFNMSASLSYTYLDTYFLNSHITGMRLRKDLNKGRVGLGAHYRWVRYIYDSSSIELNNHITGLDVSFILNFDLSIILNHEITFNSGDNYQRSYLKLIKRIR